MAVLSPAQRQAVRSAWAQKLSIDHDPCSLTKLQMQAAVDAADDWAEANAASFNSALPLAARTNLTAAQKAQLLAYVVLKRWGGQL